MHHIIIGTAGHIDHGKSALIKALTGTDPDRLKEEKEREITIDLGFAFMGDNITFIDVPGHEKFIKNMAAGVSTIDMVILVIAADDGVMPQTKEHFEILQLLGCRKGLVAVNKIDIVERDWRELVIDDIKRLVAGTFLDGAEIIPVSSVTGEGVEEVRAQILKITAEVEPRPDTGLFRLWIDRIFTMKGSGTVIAGTVLSGTCKPGDTVEILPQKRKLRVRRVQVHNKTLQQCITGERAAINLMDIEKSEIERGNMLAAPGYFQPTYMLNAKVHLLESCPAPLKNRTRVRFHLGTGEIIGRIVFLDKKDLFPGNSTIAQFRLETPVVAGFSDRYVIRSFSPARTIGGGTIVDVHPPKLKYLPEAALEDYDMLEESDPRNVIEQFLLKNPYQINTVSGLAQRLSFNPGIVQQVLEKMKNKDIISVISEKPDWSVMHSAQFRNAQQKILDFLEVFHKQKPMLSGIKKSEINARLFDKMNVTILDGLINPLINEKKIKIKREIISLSSHRIQFSRQQEKIRKKVEDIYLKKEFVTPGWDEIGEEVGGKPNDVRDVVTGLIESGILVEIKYYDKPSIFHKKCLEKAQVILTNYLKEHTEIRLGEFREMINSTRKFATPILVYFDKQGITERIGDIRRLANQ